MTAVQVSDPSRQPFYTPQTLADRLSVSIRTAYRLLADGDIASYRVGGQRRVSAEDLAEYLERHRTEAR